MLMSTNLWDSQEGKGPALANVEEQMQALEALGENEQSLQSTALAAGAIAFVHFDPTTAKSNMVEALVHNEDLTQVHRGLYVHIVSKKDGRRYSGRVVEGPFFNPDALKRDS